MEDTRPAVAPGSRRGAGCTNVRTINAAVSSAAGRLTVYLESATNLEGGLHRFDNPLQGETAANTVYVARKLAGAGLM